MRNITVEQQTEELEQQKPAGNYSAQFYPTKLANEQGFPTNHLDRRCTHTKLEEAGTMNVFFRINDTIYTAPTSERILDGVTRKSVIELAQRENIKLKFVQFSGRNC